MKKAKRTLAALTAASMSVSCIFGTNTAVFAQENEVEALTDSLTISECIDYANELDEVYENYETETGVYGVPISQEEGEIIQRVLEYDYSNVEVNYEYKYQKYDFSSDYYYNQLPSHMQNAYDQLDAACLEFMNSSVNLSSSSIKEIKFDSPLASQSEMEQLYWCFYYSNPQYFFLRNGYGYYTGDCSRIILKSYDNCQNAENKASVKSSIDSLTDEYINSVSSLATDYEKEIAIAKKISEKVTYDLDAEYNQSLMSALYYGKSVCNGYAMSMSYFCNALDIDCMLVTSYNHAWNRVKLSGEWYEADVTWYDQEGSYWDIWLNRSTATFLSNDSKNSHVVEIEEDMYNGITLPSCTDEDPSDNVQVISPAKPTNVTAVGGTNSATLTWDAVPGATKYAIAYYSNGKYTTLTANCTGTSYTATGLTAGTYQFLVQAYVNGKWSAYTTADHVSVTVSGSSSTKPTNVTAVGGTNSATLTWNAVPNATRYAIAYYSNGTYTTLTLNCTGTSYTATGLTAGKTYQFLVQANVNGQWSPFTTADHVSVTVK